MRSPAAPLPFLVAALVGGCTCGAKQQPSAGAASSAPGASSRASAGEVTAAASAAPVRPAGESLPVFSAPVAAVRVGHQDVVAGLVAAEGVVRVVGLADGHPSWTVDALRGVAWSPDAELRLQAAGDGTVLVWRGTRDGKSGRSLVVLGPRGESRLAPFVVGAAFCATTDAIVWIDPQRSGPSRVQARRWSDGEPHVVASVPAERDPGLVCGDHSVTVLGDGDDDLTASSVSGASASAAAQPAMLVLRDADFGDDEQREHDVYSVGDDLGLVRIASSGAVALRDVPHGGSPTPWRRLKYTIPADDDVVAVDGDATSTVVVITRDADDHCPDLAATPVSARALLVDRKTGDESVIDLAPADCDRSLGPFWIDAAPGAPVVAWVERRAKVPPKEAPIAAVAFRVLRPEGVRAGRVEQVADAFVDGGCDERGCTLAALVRAPGSDGMQPAPIRLFNYP